MFVSVSGFAGAYDRICRDALQPDKKVLIVAAMDVDAACACGILTRLFEQDGVQYQVYPVRNYIDVNDISQLLAGGDGQLFCAAILLNVGASYDAAELMQAHETQPNEHMTIYMFEAHRPINLYNVFGDVQIFDDGETSTAIPERDAVYLTDDEDEDDEDDRSDASDNEDTASEGGTPEKRTKRQRYEDRRLRRLQTQSYYEYSYHTTPISVLLWHLVMEKRRESNDSLWRAMVALVEAFVEDRISAELYSRMYSDLKRDMERLNASDESEGIVRTVHLREIKQDFRFPLYRHWNIYDAMCNSRYVAARVDVWKTKGEAALCNMLAQVGVSKQTCKQNFIAWTDGNARKRVMESLIQALTDMGIDHCTIPSFEYQFEYQRALSASDLAYAVGAQFLFPRAEGDWQQAFYTSLDILTMRKRAAFEDGCNKAMELERVLLRQVQTCLNNGGTSMAKRYRLYSILDTSDHKYFHSYGMLHRLARFLVDHRRFSIGARRSAEHHIVASRADDKILLVGIWAKKRRQEGDAVPNKFGSLFERMTDLHASLYEGTTATQFERPMLELKPDRMQEFCNVLVRVLTESA
ncbi:uncharacterized protein MONBRDRAFT_25659 [Monosiga brevicollis MX1]|uniref:Cell division control protein 45 n=1 Tax=Monosiga brevicollis TaxID=81824 RepID=A9V018_MONBE|nr:uncharacterized protein MONBRDRAFT_25659 [Monosiga brevicollis MX1]EDQ88934.1 predicted protein [Monosiga brevicollis MX1]|eukprot:XP_001746039.1 hypothetical protein [Monosiga brevicollis MX1]